MTTIVFSFPDDISLAGSILQKLQLPLGDAVFRRFPDGEAYVRIASDVADKDVILICSLSNPDSKILSLLFFVKAARSLGAKRRKRLF